MKNTIGGTLNELAKAVIVAGAVMPAVIAAILIASGLRSLSDFMDVIVSVGISVLLATAIISLAAGTVLYIFGWLLTLISAVRADRSPKKNSPQKEAAGQE